MEDHGAFLFKIVLIGNAGVGKTCLVRQFTQGKFPTRQGATIGVDFLIKPLQVKGHRVNMQLWDTAGQERFRAITQSYYRSAHCLVLVYDISAQPSYDSLPQWCRDIDQFTGPVTSNATQASSSEHRMLRVLVGNKCDKDREIPEHIGQKFAENNDFDLFIETSALELANVDKLFTEIAEALVERKLESLPKGGFALDSSGKSLSNVNLNNNNKEGQQGPMAQLRMMWSNKFGSDGGSKQEGDRKCC